MHSEVIKQQTGVKQAGEALYTPHHQINRALQAIFKHQNVEAA